MEYHAGETLERVRMLELKALWFESIHCPRCAAARRYEAARILRELERKAGRESKRN